MKKLILISIYSFLLLSFVWGQKESKDVLEGNRLYKSNKYTEAEVAYRRGLEKNKESFEANFNLGDALYKQGKFDKAVEQFSRAANLTQDKEQKAAAYHNIGNAFFAGKEYQKSIDAYKMSLKQNPKDNETRYNLAMAQKFLNKQQQQQNKKQQQQQQQQQPQKQENKISKDNAKQLLDAFLQDEKEVQNKVKENQQKKLKRPPVDKDW